MKDENRMCCKGKCYRNDVIDHLELEMGWEVTVDMLWGYFDMFVFLDNKLCYYKPRILTLFDNDIAEFNTESQEHVNAISELTELLGYDIDGRGTDTQHSRYIEFVDYIKGPTAGFPKFLKETEHFLIFEDPQATEMDISDIDQHIDSIQASFIDDVNPLAEVMEQGQLYVKDDKVYCLDLLSYDYNPEGLFGVLYNNNGVTDFTAFDVLTPTQERVVEIYKGL